MLGEALELEYGVDLTIGPALEEGFYYDCYMGDRCAPLPHRMPPPRRAGPINGATWGSRAAQPS